MYYCHPILFVVNWMLLLSSFFASSENLFSSNDPDDILWDPDESTTTDDFTSGFDMVNFDDPVVDPISFTNEDEDNENLFTSVPSQNRCDDAAAAEASDLTLETRDSKSSCQTNPQESSSSSSSPPILSPESIQLFQDPSSLLNNFLPPPGPSKEKKKQQPSSPSSLSSGSEEPPDPPPDDVPGFYRGPLSDEDAARQTHSDFVWDLDYLKLTPVLDSFFCTSQRRDVPVCCDGPHNVYGNIEQCDVIGA